MYYRNIYIRDFGIFNNQKIADISKNIVFIGGKNRAGKSTFFKIMKYLPYGLPQDNSIPPAKNKYYLEADLNDNSEEYQLLIDGFSETEITDSKKNNYKISQLFNNLDQLSYQQIFTISLDELQLISKIARGKKKEKRLFSILLGAGLEKLIKVPETADRYFNYANNIGGKLGDPSVAAFKPYFNEIKEAEKLRDQSLLEVKDFNNKRKELAEKKSDLKEINEKILKLKKRHFLLDLLKNNYSLIEEIDSLEAKFKSSEIELKNFEQEKIADFLSKNFAAEIENSSKKLELLSEKIKNYHRESRKIENDYSELISELESLNSKWKNPLAKLNDLKIDLVIEKNLNSNIIELERLKNRIRELENEKEVLSSKDNDLKLEIDNLEFKDPQKILKISYSALFLAFSALGLAFFINLDELSYLSLIFIAAAFIYYSSNYKTAKLSREKYDELTKESKIYKEEIAVIRTKLNEKNKKTKNLESQLDEFSFQLGNPDLAEYRYLESYFREIKDKKRRLKKINLAKKELLADKEAIIIELEKIYDLINEISNLKKDIKLDSELNNKDILLENRQELFEKLNEIVDLNSLIKEYKNKKAQLKHILKSSDRVKETLSDQSQQKNRNSYFDKFLNLYRDFSSLAAVEKKEAIFSKKLQETEQNKSNLEEKITTLKNKITELSISDKIEKAQKKINEAQNSLELKAQRYAVNRSVSFILNKLRSKMLAKAEEELLKPASEILQEITAGYYQNIETAADLNKSDFKITTNNNSELKSTAHLSRGSLEQLFLAVRMSRIKEIKPKLPLILDDSLVNFDNHHLYNTAQIIADLAAEHQIFILSCHPKLISYISSFSDSIQYWKLDNGNFNLSNKDDLIDYLNI